jgi:prolipoprotein diacylglyceryltransferase
MLPILNVGPLAVPLPGLLLIAGVWLAINLAERSAPRFGVRAKDVDDIALLALLAGVIGARLAYALRYPQAFAASPLSLLSPNTALFDLSGGLLAGLLAAAILAQRRNLRLHPLLDAFAPGLALFAVFSAAASLASGDGFGAPARLPWSIYLWGEWRHPTQVYALAAAAAILAVILIARRLRLPSGGYFWLYAALAASARLLIETFRGDSTLILGSLRVAQLVAWLGLAVSLVMLGRLLRRDAIPIQE